MGTGEEGEKGAVSMEDRECVDQRLEEKVEADEGLEDRFEVADTGDVERVNGTSSGSGSSSAFMVRFEGFCFSDHSRPSMGVDSTGPSLEPGRQREIQLVLLRLLGRDVGVAIMVVVGVGRHKMQS